MLNKLTQEDFAKHLNQRFRLRSDAGDLRLELIEATAIRTSGNRPDGKRAPFSVVFRGPKEVPLAQTMYADDVRRRAPGNGQPRAVHGAHRAGRPGHALRGRFQIGSETKRISYSVSDP